MMILEGSGYRHPVIAHKEKIMSNDPKLKLKGMVEQAENALAKAEEYAKENGLDFHFSPAYGMGGTFREVGQYDTDYLYNDYCKIGDYAWFPSSQSC
jgi:hypothetical protein